MREHLIALSARERAEIAGTREKGQDLVALSRRVDGKVNTEAGEPQIAQVIVVKCAALNLR